jgi:hypothetical protein
LTGDEVMNERNKLDKISKVFIMLSEDNQTELTHVAERLLEAQQSIDVHKSVHIIEEKDKNEG